MVVLITNVTDAPGCSPRQVDIYNKTLDPGAEIKVPADLITDKIRSLEQKGLIAIGSLPPWYVAAKMKKKGRALSEEEKAKRIVKPPKPLTPVPAKDIKEVKEAEVIPMETSELRLVEEGSARKRKG